MRKVTPMNQQANIEQSQTAAASESQVLNNPPVPPALERLQRRFSLLERASPRLAAHVAAELFIRPQRRPRAPRERELLARAEQHVLSGGSVAYVWGHGHPVLLCHGWEGRSAQLGAFVDPLVEAGYRVVACDVRGHGEAGGRRATLLDFAGAALGCMHRFGSFEAVVGHSFGGPGLCLALSRGLVARGAVLLSAPCEIRRGLYAFGDLLQLSPPTLGHLERRLERVAGTTWDAIEPLHIAGNMTIPALIFHDSEDRQVPWSDGARLAQAWPDSQFCTTYGLGHSRILLDRSVIASSVRFIQSLKKNAPSELERRLDLDELAFAEA